ncbi:unnamed protein product [Spirodela intermedia]|uniref:Uncharacterized protein n=1 Tax=Spirodela intermedia TaxID=51605 RepID=A0A7I8KHU9_SPIIN|nr:unnamed protein product [Spirodela intermedia]
MCCGAIKATCPLQEHRTLSQTPYLLRSSCSCSRSLPIRASHRAKALLRLVHRSSRRRGTPKCAAGNRGRFESGKKATPWNGTDEAMDCLGKGPSVHDLLWKQITGELEGGGGSERLGGGGGGGGGGGSSGGGSGGENGGFSVDWNELLQIFLATFSFMLVYIYLIRREEINRLSSDYIKYLMGGRPSRRLRRTMSAWERLSEKIKRKEVEGLSEYPAVSSPT